MSAPTNPNQRRRVLGAAALVGMTGLGAGVWVATHRQPKALPGEALPADFWSHQFDTLSGQPLTLASRQGHPLLLNFWATWCPPCVKELPELQQFHEAFKSKGWQVVGLAIDGPTPVREFLTKTPVGFDIGLAGFGGTELASVLGNTAGGLPFSVIIDGQGRLRQRKMGATRLSELKLWAQGID